VSQHGRISASLTHKDRHDRNQWDAAAALLERACINESIAHVQLAVESGVMALGFSPREKFKRPV